MTNVSAINIVASMAYDGDYQACDFIGVDKGCQYLIDKGIHMVASVGDFDSIDEGYLDQIESYSELYLKLEPIKDITDLEAALLLAMDMGYTLFNIYGGLGGRLDHTLTNLNLLKKYDGLIFYDETTKVVKLDNSCIHEIVENKAYQYYSFFAVNQAVLSLTDFKYPLKDYAINSQDSMCVSNELLEGKSGKVKTSEDVIMVATR